MSRAARLLSLVDGLRRRRRPVAAAALARELGVSLRTLYRDVATLRAEGAPIAGAPGLGYVLEAGFFLPPLTLTGDELDAAMLGLRLVAALDEPALASAAERALGKVVAALPPAAAEAAAASPLLAGPRGVSPLLPALRRAMRAEERLALDYRDRGGRASQRVVWPVAVGVFEDVEVLAAWCELRAGFRHFRLDRILSAEPTGDRMPKRRRLLLAEWRAAEGLAGRL